MNTRTETRESKSVRLSQDEWTLAEAICRMVQSRGERTTAGLGLREALRMAEDYFLAAGRGAELEEHKVQIRVARDAR